MVNYKRGVKELCKNLGEELSGDHVSEKSLMIKDPKVFYLISCVCFYLLTNDPEDLTHCEIISPEFRTPSSSFVLFFPREPEIHFAYAPPLSPPLSAIQYQTLLRAFVLSL